MGGCASKTPASSVQELQAIAKKQLEAEAAQERARREADELARIEAEAEAEATRQVVAAADRGALRARARAGSKASNEVPVARDPRWDAIGFSEWASFGKEGSYAVAWLTVGYLRRVARSRGVLRRRQDLPEGALHLGEPPPDVALFNVVWPWLSSSHPDPRGEQLQELVHVLDTHQAANTDLVFVEWCCVFQSWSGEAGVKGSVRSKRTPLEEELCKHALDGVALLVSYARVSTIVCPRLAGGQRSTAFLDRGPPMVEVLWAVLCQRLLSASGQGYEDVAKMMRQATEPARFANPRKLLLEQLEFARPEEAGAAFRRLGDGLTRMTPVRHDALGFERFCEYSRVAWLYVESVREMGSRKGPFPRRQELPHVAYRTGAPRRGRRKFVVSHAWESEVHPSPSGRRMAQLASVLNKLRADDEDAVFFDFCSHAQEAKIGSMLKNADGSWRSAAAEPYFAANGLAYIEGRDADQQRGFEYGSWDFGRLYAFEECEVIVLPDVMLDVADSFPGGSVWGSPNTLEYHERGWCCAEFTIALYLDRIANLEDAAVQHVLRSRAWPRTASEFAEMFAEPKAGGRSRSRKPGAEKPSVTFSDPSDRSRVRNAFFRTTLGPHSLATQPDSPSTPAGPSHRAAPAAPLGLRAAVRIAQIAPSGSPPSKLTPAFPAPGQKLAALPSISGGPRPRPAGANNRGGSWTPHA